MTVARLKLLIETKKKLMSINTQINSVKVMGTSSPKSPLKFDTVLPDLGPKSVRLAPIYDSSQNVLKNDLQVPDLSHLVPI